MVDLENYFQGHDADCDLVLIYPRRPPYHLAYLLAKTIFPSLTGNPVAPLFMYKNKIYGMGDDANLTRILLENPDLRICVLHRNAHWNSKRLTDFMEIMKSHESGKVFLRYVAVGILGILINLLFFFVFYQIMCVNDLLSIWLAIEISIIITYFLNNYWVYFNRKYTKSMAWRMGAYHATMLAGIAVNIVTYKILAILGVNYLVGDLLGILLSSIWNFYMTNVHVFFTHYSNDGKM